LRVLLAKFREVLFSVLPVTLIVLLLHFTVTPLPGALLLRFAIGVVLILFGLTVFLFGVDIGIEPLGKHIGKSLSKSNRVWVIAVAGLVLGFFISIAEPDLQILAGQVAAVTGGSVSAPAILLVVSGGVALMLVVGFVRILYNFPLYKLLFVLYGLIFALAIFVSPEFFAISFDASGATTGALAVPFVLSIALGVSAMKKNSKASEKDSFGLVAVTSTGAILGVMLMGLFAKSDLVGALPAQGLAALPLWKLYLWELRDAALDAAIALLPLVVITVVFQLAVFKFKRKRFLRLLKGLLYTLLGLILFLTGVNAGFMEVGKTVGQKIGMLDHKGWAVAVGFVIGLLTILAEPAVHVLTELVETVTAGYVKKNIVLAALAIGVGLAVGLSVLRIVVPGIQLWHYLLPGYVISIALTFITPKLFVGIAFDSGGVASGPMTATFVLAFAQGVADSIPGADLLKDAFGMIALVAMTPIITLQLLGLLVKLKSRKKSGAKTHG
jgi:hypothetical protein